MRRAFTLIELMVVVAIVGIGGALAAFNMADQVRDARATADTRQVIEDLRAEHRRARERMLGLKVQEEEVVDLNGAVVHEVRYRWTRSPDCSDDFVDAPRTITYGLARLSILRPAGVLCLNADGQPSPPPPPAGGGGVPPSVGGAQEPVLIVKADLSGADRQVVTALRIERSGLNEIGTRKGSAEMVEAIENALLADFAAAASALAGPVRGSIPGGGNAGSQPGCVDPNTGGLLECASLPNN